MISTLVALPYEIARLPLALVDGALADRLPDTSTTRVTLDRALGSADKLAGRLTSNRAIAQRGADRLDRLDKRVTAARLDEDAAAKREQADEVFRAGRRQAAEKRSTAQERIASAPEKAEAVEVRAKQEAKLRARSTASARKKSADERAVQVVESAEQQQQRKEAAAAARKKAAQRKAKAKADEARETARDAAEARADADRLDELVETKKQDRRQD
ncbi:hypothetical protein [Nocardioides sp.]|uniref:hypothetical protein n=1 Tax=Nocardioides sp. TaxID=35761 RepID=UPI001A1A1D1D|nr:hypothetical protein [Nocardioides sp.]MBJ7359312.1 hypothetical protein [Nocardioides sp.]